MIKNNLFEKLGKELGTFVDSVQGSQGKVEGRLAQLDSLLRDVYTEMKKMNNRVDTVDFQIKLLKEQVQEMNNTVVMAPMELHQPIQQQQQQPTTQTHHLVAAPDQQQQQLQQLQPVTNNSGSTVAESVNDYIKTVVTGTMTDTALPEMLSKEINRTVKNVETDAAQVAEKSCEEVLRTFGIVRETEQFQEHHYTTLAPAPAGTEHYYVQVNHPHDSNVQYMFQATPAAAAPPPAVPAPPKSTAPPPEQQQQQLQVHRVTRLPSLFKITPSKPVQTVATTTTAAEVQIVPNYLSPIGKAGVNGAKPVNAASNKLLTSIITPDKSALVTPSKAHSTPVASSSSSLVVVPIEKQSKRKSFQPKHIQSSQSVKKVRPLMPNRPGDGQIESDMAPDEFFQLTGLNRDKFNLVEAAPAEISSQAKTQPIPIESITQLLPQSKKATVKKQVKKKRIKPVQINEKSSITKQPAKRPAPPITPKENNENLPPPPKVQNVQKIVPSAPPPPPPVVPAKTPPKQQQQQQLAKVAKKSSKVKKSRKKPLKNMSFSDEE